MTLYMIGLGLYDEKDITVRGLEIIKKCDYVYLESYTSVLSVPASKLEEFYGNKVIIANRELVEKKADEILDRAKSKNVALLVVGDVFGATTHTDLKLRAKKKGVKIEVIHNASALTSVGVVGLELYKYGKTTSIPYPEKGFRPKTPYDVIEMNQKNGLHTLCLLDIKMDKNPRFMTIKEAIEYLLEIESEEKRGVFNEKTKVVGVARLGAPDQKIVYGTAKKLLNVDFGKPLHSLIIPAKLHFMEEEALNTF
ncbi:diphthine synthase [Candidatus Woesearchaeota archaeon]|nr:diphthine synthase [Candidatus Woesearchaeota archaeon]